MPVYEGKLWIGPSSSLPFLTVREGSSPDARAQPANGKSIASASHSLVRMIRHEPCQKKHARLNATATGGRKKARSMEIVSRPKPIQHEILDDGRPLSAKRTKFINLLMRKFPGPPITLYNGYKELDNDCPEQTFELVSEPVFKSPVQKDKLIEALAGCSCPSSGCTNAKLCECVQPDEENGQFRFAYLQDGKLRITGAVFECGPKCSCNINCRNRVVQRGRTVELQLFYSKEKGWGVRSPHVIPGGTFICTYPGEVITTAEAERREEMKKKDGKFESTYIFDLDKFEEPESDDHLQSTDEADSYAIDAEFYGGIGRFLNHSCEPNLWLEAVVQGHAPTKVYTLAFFAARDIPPNEELCFDYNPTYGARSEIPDVEEIDPYIFQQRCRCGSSKCRTYIWYKA
ncbi:SET domain-containing protein [Limtongia smithiae]|uniref:SET domain-containing protein n=1 Tax=Limtongia smithiae TaxID=1125753 RepID=UPI0034CFCD23